MCPDIKFQKHSSANADTRTHTVTDIIDEELGETKKYIQHPVHFHRLRSAMGVGGGHAQEIGCKCRQQFPPAHAGEAATVIKCQPGRNDVSAQAGCIVPGLIRSGNVVRSAKSSRRANVTSLRPGPRQPSKGLASY